VEKTMTGACLAAGILAILASPAGAATQSLYDRFDVSLGALAAASERIVLARAAGSGQAEDGLLVVFRSTGSLKGEAPAEFVLRLDSDAKAPEGEVLAFLVRSESGAWALRGGPEFGLLLLDSACSAAHRTALLDTVRAHLDRPAAQTRAKTLMAGFREGSPRLVGDALVDLYREPALLPLLKPEDRSELLAALSDPARRRDLAGELPALTITAGRIGGDAAYRALEAFLGDPSAVAFSGPLVKAFEALGPAWREALLDRFGKESDPSVLRGFLTVIAGLKERAALNRFVELASSADATVRKFAIAGMGDLGGPDAVAALSAILSAGERPLIERKLAVVALAETGEPAGIRRLCDEETATTDAALRDFIAAFRKNPGRERILTLRGALGK
jgi:hypothetical protein